LNATAQAPASGAKEIIFVCSALDVGGTERQFATIAAALVRLGWRVSFYSLAGPGAMQSEFERAGVRVILPPLARPEGSMAWLRRLFALALAVPHLFGVMLTRRPAVVHFLLPEAYLVGAPLAVLARIPVKVMSRRSLNRYQTSALVRAMERALHRRMQAVLGNSHSVIGELIGEGVPRRRLGLIYNGIDVDTFAAPDSRAATRRTLGLAPDALVMTLVANLIPYKGHHDLMRALAIAAPNLPADWHLLLIGRDDGIGNQLRQQADSLGIASRIVFLGQRDDVAALLAAGDIGLLCSHEEGFANAILEGMAAKLPMIVTDVGGNAEAVVDVETGLVVPARDPERLAAAIVRLANNPGERNAFGAAGFRRVGERFSMTSSVARHDRLYRALLKGGAPADIADIAVA